jgi:LysR family glycine cleavage system transcriptional activator
MLNPLHSPEDLKHHHLLRLDWRATSPWPDWAEWLAAAGVLDPDELGGDVVDIERQGTLMGDSSLLLRAAMEGQGLGLGQASLVADLIKEKQLVAPFARRLKTGFGYFLVYPTGADARPEIKVFRDWIVAEAKRE